MAPKVEWRMDFTTPKLEKLRVRFSDFRLSAMVTHATRQRAETASDIIAQLRAKVTMGIDELDRGEGAGWNIEKGTA